MKSSSVAPLTMPNPEADLVPIDKLPSSFRVGIFEIVARDTAPSSCRASHKSAVVPVPALSAVIMYHPIACLCRSVHRISRILTIAWKSRITLFCICVVMTRIIYCAGVTVQRFMDLCVGDFNAVSVTSQRF
jgi:hypothetical protein